MAERDIGISSPAAEVHGGGTSLSAIALFAPAPALATAVACRASLLVPRCDVGVVFVEADGAPVSGGSTPAVAGIEAAAVRNREPGEARTAVAREARDNGFGGVSSVAAGPVCGFALVLDVFSAPGVPAPDLGPLRETADWALALWVLGAHARQERRRGDQLQEALHSRIDIEQAKGMLAERSGVTPAAAFRSLRRHARNHHLRLADVAAAVVRREPDLVIDVAPASPLSAERRVALQARALELSARAAAATSAARQLQRDLTRRRQQIGAAQPEWAAARRERAADARARAQVLVASDPRMCTFVEQVLAGDPALSVSTGDSGGEALVRGIVEQPDVVVLGPQATSPGGKEFLAQLRRFCPETRIVTLVPPDQPVPADLDVDATAPIGDEARLLDRVRVLAGVAGVPSGQGGAGER